MPRIAQVAQHVCSSRYHGAAHHCSGCPGACPQLPRIARLLSMFPAVVTMALHMISEVVQGCPLNCPQMPRWPRIPQVTQLVCGSRHHDEAYDCSGCPESPKRLSTAATDCAVCSSCLWQPSPWRRTGLDRLSRGLPAVVQVAQDFTGGAASLDCPGCPPTHLSR